jgi:hypothetical protein
MKINSLPLWATLAFLGFLLLVGSSAFAIGEFSGQGRRLEYTNDQKSSLTGDLYQQPVPAVAKATSTVVVNPFFRISQTATTSADRSAQFAEVAYNPDDNEYLVVWQSDGLTQSRGITDIYGQRINAATNNPVGINFRISNLSDGDKDNGSNHPQVVYNKTAHEYLVVWHGTGLADSPGKFFEVYGQRLNRTGVELGKDFRISFTTDLGKVSTSFTRVASQAQVAWNSTNNEYLVIWRGMGEPEDVVKNEIYGQRLKANGELVGKSFRISHTTDPGSNFHASAPAIAYDSRGNQYLVVWSGGFKSESQTEIWGRALPASGILDPTKEFIISQASTGRRSGSPQVVYNGDKNEYLVVFQSSSSAGEPQARLNEIFAERIDATKVGEIEPKNIRISNTVGAGSRASSPAVTYDGIDKEYLVIWRSIRANMPSEIFGQRLSATGSEIEADFQISNIAAAGKDRSLNNASLTHNSTTGQCLVIWQGNPLPAATGARINEIFGQQLSYARPKQ